MAGVCRALSTSKRHRQPSPAGSRVLTAVLCRVLCSINKGGWRERERDGTKPAASAAAGVESECWARAAVAAAQRGVSLRSSFASLGLSFDLDDGGGWKRELARRCVQGLWRPDVRRTGADASGALLCFSRGQACGEAGLQAGHAGLSVAAAGRGWTPGGPHL